MKLIQILFIVASMATAVMADCPADVQTIFCPAGLDVRCQEMATKCCSVQKCSDYVASCKADPTQQKCMHGPRSDRPRPPRVDGQPHAGRPGFEMRGQFNGTRPVGAGRNGRRFGEGRRRGNATALPVAPAAPAVETASVIPALESPATIASTITLPTINTQALLDSIQASFPSV